MCRAWQEDWTVTLLKIYQFKVITGVNSQIDKEGAASVVHPF